MKNCTTIALVSFAVLAVLVTNSMATSSVWRSRSPNDILLFETNAVKNARFLVTVVADIVFPPKDGPNNRIITQVVATDNNVEYGGHVELVGGGPGHNSALLKIKSIRNRGINYTVQIYGH